MQRRAPWPGARRPTSSGCSRPRTGAGPSCAPRWRCWTGRTATRSRPRRGRPPEASAWPRRYPSPVVATSTRLKLRVAPGARRSAVVGPMGDAWKVRVAEAPERGRANDAVVALLATVLAVPRSSVTLVSGHASRNKVVALEGIDPAEADRRLAAAAGAEAA